MQTLWQRIEKARHLSHSVYEDIVPMLFCDYIYEDTTLFDEIDIDENTINLINDYFCLWYLDCRKFRFYFRTKLKIVLPKYKQMLKNEMREQLFELSNNILYREICNERIDKALNTSFRDTAQDSTSETKTDGKDSSSSTSNTESKNKTANKETPMSAIASDFDDLFEWDTASSFNENRTENEDRTSQSSTNSNTQNFTSKQNENEKQKIKNVFNTIGNTGEINRGMTQQAVESIDKINKFIMSNSHAIDFFINELKKCFINVCI